MKDYSRQLMMVALVQCDGNRTKTRMLLGLSRAKFYRLMKMHGLGGEPADDGQQQDESQQDSDWMQ